MDTWWSKLDDAVLRCLSEGALEPAEIGRRLGFSEEAATSLITSPQHPSTTSSCARARSGAHSGSSR